MAARRPPRARRHSPWLFYLFAGPWWIGFLALTAGPLIYAFWLSFKSYDGLSGRSRSVGWDNYSNALNDPKVWAAIMRTGTFVAVVVPAVTIASLLVALLLNRKRRGVSVFRTIFYLPSILPVVASALMFKQLFDRDTGLMNAIFERLGLDRVFWLTGSTARLVLILMFLWALGAGMLIFLAALQDIPSEMVEAAQLDGAGSVRRFFSITVPMVSPTIFFMIVVNLIFASQVLIEPVLIAPSTGAAGGLANTAGVPESNRLYLVEVGSQIFSYSRFGYASALLWILVVILLVLTAALLALSRRFVYYAGVEAAHPVK